MTWNVLILDDAPGFRFDFPLRQGAREHGIELKVERVYTLGQAIARIWAREWDIVFVDLGGVFPEVSKDWSEPISGFLSMAILRSLWPGAAYVVVSRLCEPRLVGPLVHHLGAIGYWRLDELNNGSPFELVADLRRAVKDHRPTFSPEAALALWNWREAAPTPPAAKGTAPRPMMVPLRPGRELTEPAAIQLGRRIFAGMKEELAPILADGAAANPHLWLPHLAGDQRFRIFSYSITRDHVSVAVARAELGVPLTRREREVLSLVLQGRSAKEICAALGIPKPRTVEAHINNVRQKIEGAPRERTKVARIALGLEPAVSVEHTPVLDAPSGPPPTPKQDRAA